MRKPPAVQWYTGDFLTGTSLMTNEEVGLYTRMLALQAEKGPLPDDVEAFVKAYGRSSRKVWDVVRAKFIAGPEPGTIINERMASVMEARDAFKQRQSEKGKASAASRFNHGSTNTQPNSGSTVVEPTGDGVGEKKFRKERARENEPEDFRLAFMAYGSVGNKQPALKAWRKLTPEDCAAVIQAIPDYVAGTHTDSVTFPQRKYFATYLNQRAWEDPPPPPAEDHQGHRQMGARPRRPMDIPHRQDAG